MSRLEGPVIRFNRPASAARGPPAAVFCLTWRVGRWGLPLQLRPLQSRTRHPGSLHLSWYPVLFPHERASSATSTVRVDAPARGQL